VRARGVAANLRAQEVLKTGCMVENISAGGLLVRTEQLLAVGTPVVMDLVRPGMKKMLKLSGRVVGVAERGSAGPNSPPGLRVMFDPMPEETTERLGQLLRELGGGSGLKAGLDAPPPPVPDSPPPPPVAPVLSGSPSVIVSPELSDPAPIAWAPPLGLDTTRAMSVDTLRTALAAADAPPPILSKEPSTLKDIVEAALAPPPVPAIAPVAPPPAAPSQPKPGPVPAAAASPGVAAPTPAPAPSPSPAGAAAGQNPGDTRLMVQIRGLLMELGEVQAKLDAKERELADALENAERLKAENAHLREKLARAEDQIRKMI
jgi:Tfp pilus assembly protein PilZ/FtsZ-binding cell division protein ZapB